METIKSFIASIGIHFLVNLPAKYRKIMFNAFKKSHANN